MASNVINLRSARKARARKEMEREAAENRRRHGLTKAERQRLDIEKQKAERRMDGMKRGEPLNDDDIFDPGNAS